ncbi:hypothetical protein J7J90_00640 [Candidatus Micrarchaeota archaeon]|nr:hypothetical protein [Candidatus Micrarchaeota archaeon]
MVREYILLSEKHPEVLSYLTEDEIDNIYKSFKSDELREFGLELKQRLNSSFVSTINKLVDVAFNQQKIKRISKLLSYTYIDITLLNKRIGLFVAREWSFHRIEWITEREKEYLKKYVLSYVNCDNRVTALKTLKKVFDHDVKNGSISPESVMRYFSSIEMSLQDQNNVHVTSVLRDIIGYFNKIHQKNNGWKCTKRFNGGLQVHRLPRRSYRVYIKEV